MKPKIYNTQFWLLCTSSLLFFASFSMIIPVLPGYLTQLGGPEYKGLLISLFTVTALLARPFSGKLADKVGRIPVIMIGAIVCIVCSFLYPLISTVSALLWLRLLHGFSTGFTPTGETAYLADIIPAEKRGEGMGIMGTANSIGMAGGMALGGWINALANINVVFYVSSALAVFSVLVIIGRKETLKGKQRLSVEHLKIRRSDLFEPRVLAPCFIMLLGAYAYGAVVTLIPDFSEYVGISNTGLLLTYFTLASLAVRLVGGKASDVWGRKPVLWVSVSAIIISMFLVATAHTKTQLIAGMILYGMAQGTTSPTLLAWATDLSNPQHKGRGVSSLYIFMEFGIGVGAFLSGMMYNNKSENFFASFMVCGALAFVALMYLSFEKSSRKVMESADTRQ